MNKFIKIFLYSIPVLTMIALIPIVQNDYILTIIYIIISIISLSVIKAKKNDFLIFIFGFGIMIVSECLFIGTGVESFIRKSLFGLMPLWLPFLWAMGFVVISKSVKILDNQ